MVKKKIDLTKTRAYDDIFTEKRNDTLLDESVKKNIKGLIDMLQDFYDKDIAPPTCTEYDALTYIPLFCINGALIASSMGVTYDEYLLATDYMIRLLDLESDENDK